MMTVDLHFGRSLMNKVDKSKYNNTWYKPGPIWKRLLWQWTSAMFFQNGFFPFNGFKSTILKIFGAKIGRNLTIKPNVTIKYPWLLEVGDYVGIGEQVWIDNLAKVKIDNQVTISQGAYLLTGNHDFNTSTFDLIIKEITLEAGVWVGARVVICPGVTCKSHSVIGVGSVVTNDTLPYSIYFGSPAKKIKERRIN